MRKKTYNLRIDQRLEAVMTSMQQACFLQGMGITRWVQRHVSKLLILNCGALLSPKAYSLLNNMLQSIQFSLKEAVLIHHVDGLKICKSGAVLVLGECQNTLPVAVVQSFHPEWLLKNPLMKKQALEDMRVLNQLLS